MSQDKVRGILEVDGIDDYLPTKKEITNALCWIEIEDMKNGE